MSAISKASIHMEVHQEVARLSKIGQPLRGKPYSMQPLPRVNPGLPHSPSSYTTLPAQMVYFTFP